MSAATSAAIAGAAAAPTTPRASSITGGRRFNQLPNALIAAVGGTAYRVAAVLAANADRRTGECFLGVRSIAKQLGGCSDRTVQRALRELEAVGYLVTTPWFDKPDAEPSARKRRDESGRQGSNLYRLCPEALGAAVIPLPSQPRQAAESAADAPDESPARRSDCHRTPVTRPTPHDPESVFDPESEDQEPPPSPPSAVPPPPTDPRTQRGRGGPDASQPEEPPPPLSAVAGQALALLARRRTVADAKHHDVRFPWSWERKKRAELERFWGASAERLAQRFPSLDAEGLAEALDLGLPGGDAVGSFLAIGRLAEAATAAGEPMSSYDAGEELRRLVLGEDEPPSTTPPPPPPSSSPLSALTATPTVAAGLALMRREGRACADCAGRGVVELDDGTAARCRCMDRGRP